VTLYVAAVTEIAWPAKHDFARALCPLRLKFAKIGVKRWRRSKLRRIHRGPGRGNWSRNDFHVARRISLAREDTRARKNRKKLCAPHARFHARDNITDARTTDPIADPVRTIISVLNPVRSG